MTAVDWTGADRLSDEIVHAVNAELIAMRNMQACGVANAIDGRQLLGGQLLALIATLRTMPQDGLPRSIQRLVRAAGDCLGDMKGLLP